MTNGDYYRMTVTDRELATLITDNKYTAISRLIAAFERWCSESGSINSNYKQNNPSPFYWQRIYNRETEQWENTCRTENVSIQCFLGQKYKKNIGNDNNETVFLTVSKFRCLTSKSIIESSCFFL